MLNKRERWIHHYSFGVRSMPEDAPNFSLLECLQRLKPLVDRYECAHLINKKTACVRLARLVFNADNSAAVMLFQYSDSNISDPAFSDLASGVLRQEPKLAGEGIAISAHALVYFSQEPKKPLEHLMLLEDAPGIGKSKILPFLQKFLKSCNTRTYTSPADRKTTVCFPMPFMDHHASQSLKNDLQRGKLSFMELTRNVIVEGFDEDPFLVKTTQAIKLKINRPEADPKSLDFINQMKLKYLPQGYSDIKVTIKYPQGKQKTVPINTAREDAGESLMGKMDIVTSDEDLLQCCPDINGALVRKMRNLIEK